MGSTKWTRDGLTIRDKEHYSTSMSKLCMTEIYSDLILVSEEGSKYPAHRSFLAARSDYFANLLYGGLKESKENEVKMMCSDKVLTTILCFLYGGEVLLGSSTLDFLMALLDETRMMCIVNLQAGLEDLVIDQFIIKVFKNDNSIKNVINIFNAAVEKYFNEIVKAARIFLENNVDEILKIPDLLNSLSTFGLKALISGNNLDLPEIEIFRGVVEWMKTNSVTSEDKNDLLSNVRLDQMTTKQLVMEIRASGLFSETNILDAICFQEAEKGSLTKLNSRKVILNQNLCLSSLGAKVVKAEKSEGSGSVDVAIDGKSNFNDYDAKSGYAMCKFGERLEVELPSKQKINKIRILLYDKGAHILTREDYTNQLNYLKTVYRDYSYRIETSLDRFNWEVIADFSNYKCRSWQTIYFQNKRVKYIGIVGTKDYTESLPSLSYTDKLQCVDTPRNYIHVISIEAMLDTITEERDRKNCGMNKILG